MELTALAARQGGVFTLSQALQRHSRADVRRHIRAGDWLPQRRGIYAEKAVVAASAGDPRATHRLACAARILATNGDLVVSHQSAALAQGIPLLDGFSGPPQLTLPRPEGEPPAHVNGLFAAYLPRDQRTSGPVPITRAPRTVADCVRELPREGALAFADAALRAGVSGEAVLEVLATCAGWPGVRQARELMRLASPKPESGLESLGRLWCIDAGLPAPEPQITLCRLEDGSFLGRVDLVWVAQRTVGELDGRLKYVLTDDADRPDAMLWQEKLREDALRDAGLEVARGYWSDRASGGRPFVERVRRAMARAVTRTDVPAFFARREQ